MNPAETYPIRPMKMCCFIFALLACALKLSADPATNSPPRIIGTSEAAKYYGSEMTVTGQVVQVTIHQNIIFINLDKPWPDCPFALVIFAHDAKPFGHLADLNGKDVEATGKIKQYHEKPEMVLESTNQLKILPSDMAK
jgi:DNA/RNA endonuclease YhcR with UshA esterase domain